MLLFDRRLHINELANDPEPVLSRILAQQGPPRRNRISPAPEPWTKPVYITACHHRGSGGGLERLNVLTDPVEDLGKAELTSVHRAVDKLVPFRAANVDVKTIATQENIRCGKSYALVAIDKSVIVPKRLHQSCSLFLNGVVIAALGPENGGFNCVLVANTVEAAKSFDQQKLHAVHFCNGQVFRHLLGEPFEQVAVASH